MKFEKEGESEGSRRDVRGKSEAGREGVRVGWSRMGQEGRGGGWRGEIGNGWSGKGKLWRDGLGGMGKGNVGGRRGGGWNKFIKKSGGLGVGSEGFMNYLCNFYGNLFGCIGIFHTFVYSLLRSLQTIPVRAWQMRGGM